MENQNAQISQELKKAEIRSIVEEKIDLVKLALFKKLNLVFLIIILILTVFLIVSSVLYYKNSLEVSYKLKIALQQIEQQKRIMEKHQDIFSKTVIIKDIEGIVGNQNEMNYKDAFEFRGFISGYCVVTCGEMQNPFAAFSIYQFTYDIGRPNGEKNPTTLIKRGGGWNGTYQEKIEIQILDAETNTERITGLKKIQVGANFKTGVRIHFIGIIY